MSRADELIESYEFLEKNKPFFIKTVDDFMKNVDICINNHDLTALNVLFDKLYSADSSLQRPMTFSSSFYRLESIKNALNEENEHHFDLFWNDVNDSSEILYKYNKTIFMLRRLIYDIPQELKDEAVFFLQNLSPYIILSLFKDSTVLVGKPDLIFITLAKENIQGSRLKTAVAFLRLVTNQNDEIKNLISNLESMAANI